MQDLQVNPAEQSAYYQQQSVQMLAQISQQIASIGTQIPLNTTTPLPYPTFHISASNRRVSLLWLMSLVCSLSAAVLSALVQQWVRAYMRVYQRSGNHLKKARVRQYFFEGVESLPVVAEAALALVHLSLILFLLGLGFAVLKIDTTIGVATAVPIVLCGFVYLYSAIAQIRNPQSPYRNPFSEFILLLIQYLRDGSHHGDGSRPRGVGLARMEARQDKVVMEQTKERKARDVHAVQWLVDSIDWDNEVETFLQAIPGSFNQKWGQDVWKAVSFQGNSQLDIRRAQPTSPADVPVHPRPYPPCPTEGTTVDDLCRSMRFLIAAYNCSMDKEARRRCMQGCIETVASLVCCTNVQLDWFGEVGEVGEVLSEVGHTEGVNVLSTIRSIPLFTIQWTCLSLVAIRQIVMVQGNKLQELAMFTVDGIARFQLDYGPSDAAALRVAQRIDEYLKTAWEHVMYLHRSFEPWDVDRTEEEIRNILGGCKIQISELERIENEAKGMDVDWRISLLQDAMDEDTHGLTRLLPGVSYNELRPSGPGPIPIGEAFDFPLFGNTPITPQFIFPGQQLQGFFSLGRGLRDIIENRNTETHMGTVESLKSIDKIPVPSRQLEHLMTRQVWRLQDIRHGGGLGFTTELFFLALRQLSPTSSSRELKEVFYIGTFKVITSGWEDITDLSGTLGLLLHLMCDLVIKSRGVFSDFPYPPYIVDMLLEPVENMVNRHGNPELHADAVEELSTVNSWDCMDRGLQDEALRALGYPPS